MKKLFLLFSHDLSDIQINDVKSNFNVNVLVPLTKELQKLWSNVPPDIDSLENYLLPFRNFLIENSNYDDVVLVQGDFGAVYKMVNFCKDLGLIPIYATTVRQIEEFEENGKTIKKSVFEHRRFRKYD